MLKSVRIAGLLIACLSTVAHAGAVEYVGIEAERPTSVPSIKPPEGKPDEKGYAFTGWGDTSIISEGKLLSLNLSDREAPARLG
ncbi:MAG: hypothetical protein WBF17_00885, partial [Phycisphaerae bacterium]